MSSARILRMATHYRGTGQNGGIYLTSDGQNFLLGNSTVTLKGTNVYEINSDGTSDRGCGMDMYDGTVIEDALTQLNAPPNTCVLRGWFFQRFTVSNGQRDWSRFDKSLTAIRQAGYRIIATLGNEWGDGEVNQATGSGPNWDGSPGSLKRSTSWYQNGYASVPDPGMLVAYKDWVQEIVERYKDNPAIAFWQLMNEPEASSATDGTPGVDLLRNFCDDIGAVVKATDSNHLLSLGSIGTGQTGLANNDYVTVHASPYINICEVHDYSPNSTTLAGDQWNGLAVRVQQAQTLRKPIFVGEFGNIVGAAECPTYEDRATLFSQKLQTYFTSGFAGALLWNYTVNPAGLNSYDIGPNDPSLGLLRS